MRMTTQQNCNNDDTVPKDNVTWTPIKHTREAENRLDLPERNLEIWQKFRKGLDQK